MAATIKPCLYIGLGGTGMSAILNTKKMFVETYGEVPPMIQFLGIDTDRAAYDKKLMMKDGRVVALETHEQMAIYVEDPRPLYRNNPEYLSWFPGERNSRALNSMKNGAGQVRSNGRFAFWCNHKDIQTAINAKFDEMRKMENVDNGRYASAHDAIPEVHIIFSLCGGTGCGTFINVAYLIRKAITVRQPKIYGYGVLPGVFLAMDESKMPNVRANAYGALRDLDWLMYAPMDREAFDVDNLNEKWTTNERPYDSFMLIDNKNANGDTLTKIDQISQMLSLSLVTEAGEISSSNSSTMDNVEKQIDSGDFDVAGKQAWATAIGVCEITVNSTALGHLYAMKAAQRIISNLIAAKADATDLATNWINRMEIRENNGHDQVIDYMFPKVPRQAMPEILNCEAPDAEVDQWVRKAAAEADDLRAYPDKVKALSEKVFADLAAFVKEHLNQPNGVKDTENILVAIKSQIEACDKEMKAELNDFRERKSILEGSLIAAKKTLAGYKKPWFGKNHQEEYKESVAGAAKNLAVNIRETFRREAAINFYSGLKEELDKQLKTVHDIAVRLDSLYKDLEAEIAESMQRLQSNEQIFQIDTTGSFVNQVRVAEDDSLVSYFLQQADVPAMAGLTEEALEKTFLDYTANLNDAKEWDGKTIEDVLSQLDKESLGNLLDRAVRKSAPLLGYNYDHLGKYPAVNAQDYFYVGVYDKAHTVLTAELLSKHVNANHKPDLCNIGSRTSIIIYRKNGPIPPCAMLELESYKEHANKARWDISYDAIIEARMDREGWSIFPTEAASDALQLWVKGLIFKLIRNEKGRYQYQDYNESSRALQNFWVDLEHPKSGDRATAFQLFKQKMMNDDIHRSYVDELQKRISAIGDNQYQETLRQVRDADYYYDNVSQINLKRETLGNVGYEDIQRQITDEVNYVLKSLE